MKNSNGIKYDLFLKSFTRYCHGHILQNCQFLLIYVLLLCKLFTNIYRWYSKYTYCLNRRRRVKFFVICKLRNPSFRLRRSSRNETFRIQMSVTSGVGLNDKERTTRRYEVTEPERDHGPQIWPTSQRYAGENKGYITSALGCLPGHLFSGVYSTAWVWLIDSYLTCV